MNGLNFFRAGAVVLILFGLAHLAGHLSSKDAPPQNEQERQLKELMYGYKTNLMGAMRSQGEIVDGFSLAISIFTIGAGAVALVTARSRDPRLLFHRPCAMRLGRHLRRHFPALLVRRAYNVPRSVVPVFPGGDGAP